MSRIQQAERMLLLDAHVCPGMVRRAGVCGGKEATYCLTPLCSFLGPTWEGCRTQGWWHTGVTQIWWFWLSPSVLGSFRIL